jgi:hypothetical protein
MFARDAIPFVVLRFMAAPLVKSYEIPAPYEWATGAVPLPLFSIAVLVRLLVSPFLWPCIHMFVPSAHTSFHMLRQGAWLVRSNGLACCRGSITAASPSVINV